MNKGMILLSGLMLAGSAFAAEYHVAVSGNDESAGTRELPFQTIQRAADVMQAGDVCHIGPGRYRETVTVKTAGSPDAPVRFAAVKAGTVVIDGTEVISTPWKKEKGGIYKTPLDFAPEQVFFDQRPMIWARWPNMKFGENWFDHKKWARTDEGSQPGRVVCSELSELDFDLVGATVYIKYSKGNNTWSREILSMNDDGLGFKWNDADFYTKDRTAEDGFRGYGEELEAGEEKSKRLGLPHPLANNEFFIRGKLELLDAEEEWFHDAASGTLYFYAPASQAPEGGKVRYKKRDYGFFGEGVAHLELKGIAFFGCSLDLEGRNITLDQCRFLYPDENLFFPDCIAMKEDERYQFKPVAITGYNNTVVNCLFRDSIGDTLRLNGFGNLVENCVVTGGNRHGRHDNKAIWFQNLKREKRGEIEETRANTVRRCTIYNTGGIGIYMLAISPEYGGGRAEYNHIFNAGWYCTDISAFYAPLWFNNGCLNNNWFHNVQSMAYRVDIRGINVTYHHNVAWNCLSSFDAEGVFFNIYNNTSISGCRVGQHRMREREEKDYDPTFPPVTEWPVMNNIATDFNDTVSLKELQWFRPARSQKTLHPDRKDRVQPMQMEVGNIRSNFIVSETDSPFVSLEQDNLDLRPAKGSPLIDAGVVVEGITDGYKGSSPDIGAYEYGGEYWFPGANWLPDGLSVPKTMAEANRLALKLQEGTALRPREKRKDEVKKYE